MLICVSGCVQSGQVPTEPVTIDTACKWVGIIYLHGDDYKLMDARTLRAIDAHNTAVTANCLTSKS